MDRALNKKKRKKKKYFSPKIERIVLNEEKILTADCSWGTNTPTLGDCGDCNLCIKWSAG